MEIPPSPCSPGLTFNAAQGRSGEQPILYITERRVFVVVPGGLRLFDVAPRIDIERDILAHMTFRPL